MTTPAADQAQDKELFYEYRGLKFYYVYKDSSSDVKMSLWLSLAPRTSPMHDFKMFRVDDVKGVAFPQTFGWSYGIPEPEDLALIDETLKGYIRRAVRKGMTTADDFYRDNHRY